MRNIKEFVPQNLHICPSQKRKTFVLNCMCVYDNIDISSRSFFSSLVVSRKWWKSPMLVGGKKSLKACRFLVCLNVC